MSAASIDSPGADRGGRGSSTSGRFGKRVQRGSDGSQRVSPTVTQQRVTTRTAVRGRILSCSSLLLGSAWPPSLNLQYDASILKSIPVGQTSSSQSCSKSKSRSSGGGLGSGRGGGERDRSRSIEVLHVLARQWGDRGPSKPRRLLSFMPSS